MRKYAASKSAVGTWYVYRGRRYKVMARDLSKSDAQLIAKALNKLADEEDALLSAIRHEKRFGPMM